MNKHFDYLVVGAGLFGAVFSREMNKRGRSCLVIDKREHVAGNIYTSLKRGIHVHEYGAHIFHTSNRKDRGIEGMAYGTVIRMCDRLSLNPVDFSSLEKGEVLGEKILENRVMQYYIQLNKKGRKRILEMMEDYVQLEKYRES